MSRSTQRTPARSSVTAPANAAIKETLESIVIAFVLAFVFRAYVVEAFVIPTGSMAPTLLGEHLSVTCPQCGYRFTADVPDIERAEEAICPMCAYENPLRWPFRVSAGDRILVLKYLYTVSTPRRWDVVVFKAPHEPKTNFIKRLVGKPGECVLIIEGNVYVQPGQTGNGWRIARKTHREEVQRSVFEPIYYSQFIPLDPNRGRRRVWQVPWEPIGGDWKIENLRSYRHDGAGPGVIAFSFERAKARLARWHPYNQLKKRYRGIRDEPIEDIRLSATFEPAKAGLSIRMRTTARWNDSNRRVPLSIGIAADGEASFATGSNGTWDVVKSKQLKPFLAGRYCAVELWYVDQELSLWIDGQLALAHHFELSLEQLKKRRPLSPEEFYPQIAIEVEGAPVTLHRVELDRDLFYSSAISSGHAPGRSTLVKLGENARGEATYQQGQIVCLGDEEYYCLGDNSPMSHDGRYWEDVNPWIKDRLFQGASDKEGIVPHELMLGRAFFVYFPAPHRWRADQPAVFPNFGDMRFIY